MGSLRQNLCSVSQMKWIDKLSLLHCISSDLQIIHSQKLIHRYLHSGNILQDNLHSAYIADLGLSISTIMASNTERRGIYGVLPYIAPEALDRGYYSTASDIYSFGTIMWEILYGRPVSYNRKFGQLLQIEICRNDLRPIIIGNMPIFYINLMKKCWERDLEKRPSATNICEILTEWINNENILLNLNESNELLKNIKSSHIPTYPDLYKGGAYIVKSEPVNADGDTEILKFLRNTSLQWIPFKDLQIIKEIGKGGFANVFLAKCNLNGSTKNVALKFLRGSRNNFEALLKENPHFYNVTEYQKILLPLMTIF
ncbi:kinase-like domain-containing protein [Gigaspora rosea]|uniref:Kinase-like domain-containing protein n=1 Tax=Gigaspora rosea TaxID=44941 RepID=A0A397URT3_9GLOM|nr:kinase-like domain-containing protein [Gigaspora rosea]